MKKFTRIQFAIVFLFVNIAYGNEDKLLLAKEIISLRTDVQAINTYCYTTITRITHGYIDVNRNTFPDSTLQAIENIAQGFIQKFKTHEDEIKDSLAGVYVEFYSLKELRELKKFYESKIGSKMLHLEAEIERRFMNKSNEIVQKVFVDYISNLKPYIDEKNLRELFGR